MSGAAVLYLDRCDGCIDVYIRKNAFNCALKLVMSMSFILLYFNKEGKNEEKQNFKNSCTEEITTENYKTPPNRSEF